MARIQQVMLLFSSSTITSAGFILSDTLDLTRQAYASIHYTMNETSTGTFVSATAQMLVSADRRETFILPIGTSGAAAGTLCQINSNNSYIRTSIPLAPLGQVRITSSTNSTIMFDAVYLILDEHN